MRNYKEFIRKDEVTDRKIELEVAPRVGSFNNNEFSNEAFEKLSSMEGFKETSGGKEFYFEKYDSSLAIRKSSKEAFAKEGKRLQEHFYHVAKLIAENIKDDVKTYKFCPVCGYTKFGSVRISSTEGAYFKTSDGNGARLEYCKKCRSIIVEEFSR